MPKQAIVCFAALKTARILLRAQLRHAGQPVTIAQCNYGEAFTAAVQKDNFFGVQFHPERSGAAAQLLKNFLEM
jgi:imidazoleglycerol phosphate synthase glutamine amidotransferase subunit HisH